jgi:hypothetical protein
MVPAGMYMRVDDEAHAVVELDRAGPLPASLDGHVALYHAVAATYSCRACGHPAPPSESERSEQSGQPG